MSPALIFVLALFGVAMLGHVLVLLLRRKYSRDLVNLLMKGEYDAFDKKCDKFLVRYCISPFNLTYMRLNRYLMEGDAKKASEIFEMFKGVKLKEKEKSDIAFKAFNFYLSQNDKENCAYYRDQINSLPQTDENKQAVEAVNLTYEVLFEDNVDRLDELLEQTKQLEDMYKGGNEFLIAHIYEVKGDQKNARKYTNLANKHTEMYQQELLKQAAGK